MWLLAVSFGLFALTLGVGFLSGVANLFILPLTIYAGSGVGLLWYSLSRRAPTRIRRHVLTAGLSALTFWASVLYGVLGIWGFYEVFDPLYVGSVLVSTLVFLVSFGTGMAALLRNPSPDGTS